MNFSRFANILLVVVTFIASAMAGVHQLFDDQGAASELRAKRDHHHQGITGPVHTFVKTDKNANFKWGVRHHVGHHYAGR